MTLRLYLMRHGETAWSLNGQHSGRADIPLTKNGESEAKQLRKRIHSIAFAHVFCSPLTRAINTCKLAGLGNNILVDHDLAEWDNGDYEGKTHDEIFSIDPNWNIFRDGCPHGEYPTDIGVRADRLVARFGQLEGNVAIFAHSHLGRVLAARWLGLGVEHAKGFLLNTASISILSADNKRRSLTLWNSTLQNSVHMSSPQERKSSSVMKRRAIERWENEGGEIQTPSMPS